MLAYLMLIEDDNDRIKFEKLYLQYRLKMQYVAYEILQDEHEAENIVHDTFVTLIGVLDHVDESDCCKAWNYIVTILKNKCFNYLKRTKRLCFYEDGFKELSDETDINESCVRKELSELVAGLIQKLDYPEKEVILLQYYNGLKGKEIAEILGLSPVNVRQIAKRARQKLMRSLQKMGYENEK